MQRIYTTADGARRLKKGWDRAKDRFEVNEEGSSTILSFGNGYIRRKLDGLDIVVDAIPEVPPRAASSHHELTPP